MPWAALAMALGSLFSGISQQNIAKGQAAAASAEQTQLDQQLINLFQGPLGADVQNLFIRMIRHPEYIIQPLLGAQENILGNESQQALNTYKSSLGSATPNEPGTINDIMEKILQSRANLGSAAIGQETALQGEGASGLMQFINSFGSALSGVAGQYGAAGSQIASNVANSPNPFASTFGMLSNPNIDWSQISKLFQGAGNPGTSSALYTTQSGVPYAP